VSEETDAGGGADVASITPPREECIKMGHGTPFRKGLGLGQTGTGTGRDQTGLTALTSVLHF